MSISKADIFSIYQGCWFFNSLRISKLSCRIFVIGLTLDELRFCNSKIQSLVRIPQIRQYDTYSYYNAYYLYNNPWVPKAKQIFVSVGL